MHQLKLSRTELIILTPALAYIAYKLGLEVWCVAYGLIYWLLLYEADKKVLRTRGQSPAPPPNGLFL